MDLLVKNFCKVCINFKKVSFIRRALWFLPLDVVNEISVYLEENIPSGLLDPLESKTITRIPGHHVSHAWNNHFIKQSYKNGVFYVKRFVKDIRWYPGEVLYGVLSEKYLSIDYGGFDGFFIETDIFFGKKRLYLFPDFIDQPFQIKISFTQFCDVLTFESGPLEDYVFFPKIYKGLFGKYDGKISYGAIRRVIPEKELEITSRIYKL